MLLYSVMCVCLRIYMQQCNLSRLVTHGLFEQVDTTAVCCVC